MELACINAQSECQRLSPVVSCRLVFKLDDDFCHPSDMLGELFLEWNLGSFWFLRLLADLSFNHSIELVWSDIIRLGRPGIVRSEGYNFALEDGLIRLIVLHCIGDALPDLLILLHLHY